MYDMRNYSALYGRKGEVKGEELGDKACGSPGIVREGW